jgi:vitamin B12 transporter
MIQKIIGAGALCVLVSSIAFAQNAEKKESIQTLNEVVITDSKFALEKEKSGKIIVTITSEDLEKRAGQSVATVLNSIVGLEVNGSQSGAGKNLGYFIRGARNRQTLLLIDGIPVTDASGVNLEYDLRLLPIEQVERIEVMKGAASTLYGSGAAAGVISITLKKSKSKKLSGTANISMGTQMTASNVNYKPQDLSQGISVNGSQKYTNYFASINSTETKGISEAKGDNFEEDRFSRVNALVKFGIKSKQNFAIDFVGNYDRIKNNFDSTFDNFNETDTPLNTSLSSQFRFGIAPKFKYDNGELIVNVSVNSIIRNYSIFDSWTNAVATSEYQSKSSIVDGYNKYTFSKQLFAVIGAQLQFHEMNINSPYESISDKLANFNTLDSYFTAVYNSEFGFNLNIGARYNTHNVYDHKLVFNINPSYLFADSNLKIIYSYSTAYLTPSLYQLYSPYGNLELIPEDNSTLEMGFELTICNKKLQINSVAFYREEKNSIGFYSDPLTWVSKYVNVVGKNNVKGIETMLSYHVSNRLKIDGNYSYCSTKAPLNLLLPTHKINLIAEFDYSKRTFFNLNYQLVGNRNDAYFDGGTYEVTRVNLSSYQVINALAKYELIDNRMTVFGTISNLFNADFIENSGYSTRGRNFKLGVLFRL